MGQGDDRKTLVALALLKQFNSLAPLPSNVIPTYVTIASYAEQIIYVYPHKTLRGWIEQAEIAAEWLYRQGFAVNEWPRELPVEALEGPPYGLPPLGPMVSTEAVAVLAMTALHQFIERVNSETDEMMPVGDEGVYQTFLDWAVQAIAVHPEHPVEQGIVLGDWAASLPGVWPEKLPEDYGQKGVDHADR